MGPPTYVAEQLKRRPLFKILYWSSDSEDNSWGKRLLHVWSLLARLLDSGSRAWLGWCWWCDMTQLNMEQLTFSEWLREQQVVVISSIKFSVKEETNNILKNLKTHSQLSYKLYKINPGDNLQWLQNWKEILKRTVSRRWMLTPCKL